MGTKLNEGICRRLGATWSRPRRLVCVLLSLLAPLVVLVAPEAAQALTLPAMPTAGSLSSTVAGAAAIAGDTASAVQSVTAAAAGAADPSAPAPAAPSAAPAAAPSAGAASGGGSSAGAAPVQHQVAAAVQFVRTAVSRAVSAASASASGDPAPAPPVPTVATDPPAVPTSSSVQQSVTAALQRAGVSAGTGGSDPVPVTVSPGSVAGTGGLRLDPQILAAVGDLATRLGTSTRTLLAAAGARSGAAALTGQAGAPGAGRGRRSPSSGRTRNLGHGVVDAATAWRLPLLVSGLERGGTWAGRRRAVPGSARLSAPARAAGPGRSRPAAADPAPPASLPVAPAPGAPATAGGAGVGTGAAAVMLFIIAAIWLLQVASDRMSLEAVAWREPLLALRLERPG